MVSKKKVVGLKEILGKTWFCGDMLYINTVGVETAKETTKKEKMDTRFPKNENLLPFIPKRAK